MNQQTYMKILRLFGLFVALMMWYLSVKFSMDGFNIEVKGMEWAGFCLAICVTVMELIGNKIGFNTNLTLAVGGLLCYAYGIGTNVIGIAHMQGVDIFVSPEKSLFAIVVGLLLEILPEPLFVWALTNSADSGDLFGNLIGGGAAKGIGGFSKASGQLGFKPSEGKHRPGREEADEDE